MRMGSNRWRRRLTSILLLIGLLAGALPASARGAATSISIFYPATQAAFDAWEHAASLARPHKTTTFPSQVRTVAFYYQYTGARAKSTRFAVIVLTASGSIYATYGPDTFQHEAALRMDPVAPPSGGSYADGRYYAELMVDGSVAATTNFSVGSTAHATIDIFYPATKSAYDAWNQTTTTLRPPQTTSFPAGTTIVSFYFEYTGAKPKSSMFQINILTHTGAIYVRLGPFAAPSTDGIRMSSAQAPAGATFPRGAYRANLLVNGHVVTSTFFSVDATQATPPCNVHDPIATCLEPSILRLHANLPDNSESEGTGFVVQSDSTGTYVLTNKHVIAGANVRSLVALSANGSTTYTVLAIQANSADEGTAGDLAVVKLPPSDLKPLQWGDAEQLHLLQRVISIGYGEAFDLPGPPTVTEGAVSALHRDLGDGFGPVWIQHQSFINHGNSGGPLLDATYRVVGVNTLGDDAAQGIFFAIPSTIARQVAAKLIASIHH